MKQTIVTVLGTRPEIIKFSPVLPLFDARFEHVLIHTGQHYDENMDRIFFRELKLRQPAYFLNVGSAGIGPVVQIGRMLERLEPIVSEVQPDWVAVLGDTNSTLAGALVAAKLNAPVVHFESGCRSFNRAAPEEQNRIIVDHLAALLLAPDRQAVDHLRDEGIDRKRVHLIGNTGLDATRRAMRLVTQRQLRTFGVRPETFVLATLHRAESTDDGARLSQIVAGINKVSEEVPVLFPIHPRTVAMLQKHRIQLAPGVRRLEPIGNLEFLALLKNSLFVMSDSGGVQEEAAVVNRPCLVLRDETEWTRLIDAGKNFLTGTNPRGITKVAQALLRSPSLRRNIRRKKAPLQFGATQKAIRLLLKK